MESNINIKVTTKHFRKSTGYTDPWGCPLAMAIKDVYPNSQILINIGNANIDGVNYEITYDWCFGQNIYGGKLKNLSIDEMIKLAKEDKSIRFPTKMLMLNRW
jgi:hypothetical protein